MATYKEIQTWVKQNYGFVPETCWTADVKSQTVSLTRKAPNHRGTERAKPCPLEKVKAIQRELRHFGMTKRFEEFLQFTNSGAHLRTELDTNYAPLYGLTCDELRYILDPK